MMNKETLRESFRQWLPLAVVIVIVCALVYVAVQQNYRLSANDPQIQIAEDGAHSLEGGKVDPAQVFPPSTVEISSSLAPFLGLYSATGTPIGASAVLDGKLPVLPSGVFDYANKHGQDRFTWQPKPGLRAAVVLLKYDGPNAGYVMAGRLLTEVEIRIKQLTLMAAIATALALVLSFLVIALMQRYQVSGSSQTINLVEVDIEK